MSRRIDRRCRRVRARGGRTFRGRTDYTEEANSTIAAVSQSDHYPGEGAFIDQGAEDGIWLDYVIIDADGIDYSDCDTENTAAFGIDRGNDNQGTEYDEYLVQHQKQSDFRDDGVTVEFFDHEDVAGDQPYLAPEDAIVAEQGENSAAGGCLSMTEEEGWYRLQGFANGTVADNGEDEEPSENADEIDVSMKSTRFYICDCESEEKAREELGDPPGETADSDAGDEGDDAEGDEEDPEGEAEEATPEEDEEGDEEATPEDGDGEEPGDEEAMPDEEEPGDVAPAEEEDSEEEPGDEEATPEAEETADEEPAEEEPPAEENETDAEEEPEQGGTTPTVDDGSGFGAVAALVVLLANALLLNRRR